MANKKLIDIIILFVIFVFFAFLFYKPWLIGDGLHYYAQLRSIVIDKDINFTNEYTYLRTLNQGGVTDPNIKTKTGLVYNSWAIGTAIFWSPFFLTAHLIEIIRGNSAGGYSQIYFTFVTLGTMLYSFIGLVLIYFFLRKFVRRKIALMATIIVFIGSSLFYYTYIDPSMSHAISMFAVTSFICYWYYTRKNRTVIQHLLLGFLSGLMVLTRWQDAIFLLLVLYDIFEYVAKRDFINLSSEIFKKIFFFTILLITFVPQMIFWKIIYGSFLLKPPGTSGIHLYPKYIVPLLFSTKHGLFIWTPIVFFSFIGFYFLFRKNKKLFSYMAIPGILQILFVSSTEDWYGSWSYGIRFLASCTLIFAAGFAYLLKELNKKMSLHVLFIFLLPFIVWNLLLMSQIYFYHPTIDPSYPFEKILSNQIKIAPKLLINLILRKLGF